MKRVLTVAMVCLLAFALAACGGVSQKQIDEATESLATAQNAMQEKTARVMELTMQYTSAGMEPSAEITEAAKEFETNMTEVANELTNMGTGVDESDKQAVYDALVKAEKMVTDGNNQMDSLISMMEAELG